MEDWASLVKPGETSELNKDAKRKIWFREHSSTIIPILTLLAGFIMGAIILIFVMQIRFSSKISEYELTISELEKVVSQKEMESGNEKSIFEEKLSKKDEIINLLTQQNETMGNAINFTRRLSRNSTITPNSPDEVEFFKRNIRYLQSQYEKQKELLDTADFQQSKSFNLLSIPQLFEE